jgi:hypothetical protein
MAVLSVHAQTLSGLRPEDLAMLAENETLFVEHKWTLAGSGYQIAKASAAFARPRTHDRKRLERPL